MGFPISVFNLRYDLGFVNGEYRADIDSYTNFDPDEIITSNKQTKSIVFGCSSNSICGKLRLRNIKLSFTESRNPFKISLVSSVNTNMPDKNYQYARVNSFGDIWAKTIKNLIFISQRNRTVFDMTDSQNDNITHFVSSSNFKLGFILLTIRRSLDVGGQVGGTLYEQNTKLLYILSSLIIGFTVVILIIFRKSNF